MDFGLDRDWLIDLIASETPVWPRQVLFRSSTTILLVQKECEITPPSRENANSFEVQTFWAP